MPALNRDLVAGRREQRCKTGAAGSGHGLRATNISQDRTSMISSSQGELSPNELFSQGLYAETPSHSSLRVRAAGDPSESCRYRILTDIFSSCRALCIRGRGFSFQETHYLTHLVKSALASGQELRDARSEVVLVTVLPKYILFYFFYFTSPSMLPAQSRTGNWDTCPRAHSEKGEVPLSEAGLSFCRHLISNVLKGKHLFNFPIKELDRIKQGLFFSLTNKEACLKENPV